MTEHPKDNLPSHVSPIALFLAVVLTIILLLMLLPYLNTHRQSPGLARKISNARDIKSALDLFAGDFDGEYPSDDTAEELMEINRSSPLAKATSPRTTSNYYFNQLIGRGLENEENFYTKSPQKTFLLRKPNNDGIVDQGENIWGYIKNLQWDSSSHLPLIFDSSVSVGNSLSFSKRSWDGRIVIARLDGSIRAEILESSDPEKGTITNEINGRQIDIFSPEVLEGGVCLPADLKRIGSK